MFESIVERKLPVKVDSQTIALEENYFIVSKINTNVDSVLFKGAETPVNELPDPFFILIDEDELDSDFNEQINLDIPSELVQAQPPTVRVEFQVARFVRVSRNFPIDFQNFPADSSFYLNQDSITLSYMAQEGREDEILDEEFHIVADLFRMVPSDSTIQPVIKKYSGKVRDINIESDRVKVIKKE